MTKPMPSASLNSQRRSNRSLKNQFETQRKLQCTENEAKPLKFWKRVQMRLLRRQSERGNVEAMTCLAANHMDLQNFDEATRWFRKAAELGFPDAQLMLGSAYD